MLTFNPFTGNLDYTVATPVVVSDGGTGLSTIAAGSILAANSLDTLSAITSTSAVKELQNNAGTIAWNTVTGTGDSVLATAPTFVTSITAPLIYGGTGASGTLSLQSTSNSTRGTVDVVDVGRVGTAAQAFGAASGIYLDVGTGNVSISTGAVTAVRMANTITAIGNSASACLSLFNAAYTVTDDGTARTLKSAITLSSNPTFTTATAGGLTCNDLVGIPAYTGLYYVLTTTRSGAGTGTMQTAAGLYISVFSNIGVGWTVTNYVGVLIDKPTVGGTLTNFYGVKNNGAAATNQWFLYETGGMQSSHKGKMRFGDNTAPGALVELAPGAAGANTAPLKFTSGTNLTTAEAGACEYDGVQVYGTIDTSSGRGCLPVEQVVHLTAAGGAITTIANFFGATSNISLVASAYYLIEIFCYFLKDTSASVVTWTFTNSAAPTGQNIESEFSPITGIVTGTPTATTLFGHIYNDATAAKTIATGSLSASVNHFCRFRIMLKNGTGTSLKIQATVTTGNITPGIGSYWRARRLSPNNIGTLAA